MKAKVSKVVLDVNGKKLELTPAAARELRDALNELIGGDRHEYHYHDWRPWPYRYQPYIWTTAGLQTTSGGTGQLSCNSNEVRLTA